MEILEEVHITVPTKRSSLLENILLSDTPDERKHKFLTSRKGGVQLIHEEYLYRSNLRRQGREGDILYWECIHNRGTKCRGRLKTVGNTIHKSNGKVDHNHDSDKKRIGDAVNAGTVVLLNINKL